MTDKIMIDGVDVSGCEFLQEEERECTCYAEDGSGDFVTCSACTDCYYKQLARKTEELQAEKQKTENEYNHYQFALKLSQKNFDKYTETKQQLQAEQQKVKAYRQALEEIKKITTELYLGVKDSDRPYCEKILQKCEVLDER